MISALLRSLLACLPGGRLSKMPNIKQQQKRVRVSARQRLENLRYRSTIKTLTRRLETAVEEGDAATVDAERRRLEHWLDLAAVRGAIPQEQGGAAQVAGRAPRGRDRAGGGEHAQARPPPPPLAGLAARLFGARDRQRALELEVAGQPAAALERMVERRERVVACRSSSTEKLATWANAFWVTNRCIFRQGGLARSTPLLRERLTAPHPCDVIRQQSCKAQELVAARAVRACEQLLGRPEGGCEVATSPGVGEREDGRLRSACHEVEHISRLDRLSGGPDRELVDLGGQLVRLVTDQLDQR